MRIEPGPVMAGRAWPADAKELKGSFVAYGAYSQRIVTGRVELFPRWAIRGRDNMPSAQLKDG
jgi:hypothetical protein